ncbi:zonular occludens toxin domain-containing protein [Paraburkholderia sp. SARCC-3016]|uniref:zonular occludens toxin domain-containing protein n=1 Tax=Paraburkholderia sp. SARCC-3016 TaxID=3058611 RepID=UPI002806BF26|nr:zonular occludens toxin domain-containing protein [Paraburkholderia sp. SARCC-3016]MDQ7982424.1 zonular occludens toxin domain-containing protein [Paraburkholderia sp. SARCC-3016]
MAINAYCGVMGSGKSYEVVSGPLLDAVARGRRVVTNIDGVSGEAIHSYLHEKRGIPDDMLGEIVHVRTDDMLREGFFPVEVEGSHDATVTPGFVKPGDLLVVDEAWKLWATDKKISREHMAFFRMHRHFVHEETGVACDVVLMIQSIADLHRSIKAVIELSFRMVKLKSLGLSSGYRVEMYETYKQTKGTQTGTFIRKYRPEIFPLYKSYAGAGGRESTVDKRQNVLMRKTLWLMVAGVVAMVVVAWSFAWRFFHPPAKNAHTTKRLRSLPPVCLLHYHRLVLRLRGRARPMSGGWWVRIQPMRGHGWCWLMHQAGCGLSRRLNSPAMVSAVPESSKVSG